MSRISKTRRMMIECEVASWPDWKQDFFQLMVDSGQSISMAHMLASQQAPRSLTDDTVMSGMRRIKDLPDGRREYICQQIVKNGGSVSMWDTYQQGMANYTGDPAAVIGHGDCLSKIRKVANERGEFTTGIIDVDGRKNREMKQAQRTYALHPRIVERRRREMLAKDPSLAKKNQNELRESIIEKHSFKGK